MRDGLLELIVKFAEGDSALETPITLIVSGLLVSGFIISRDKYLEENPLTAKIKEIVETQPEESIPKSEDSGTRKYIHLRDAKYFSPGQAPIPTSGSVQCRIKLSDVSGFNFGSLSFG